MRNAFLEALQSVPGLETIAVLSATLMSCVLAAFSLRSILRLGRAEKELLGRLDSRHEQLGELLREIEVKPGSREAVVRAQEIVLLVAKDLDRPARARLIEALHQPSLEGQENYIRKVLEMNQRQASNQS